MAANRDIIVIGTSAGGVQALLRLAPDLPPGLPASVFIVIHLPPDVRSELPELLGRAGPLPAAWGGHDQPFAPGRIYVAPPDRHLLLDRGRMLLSAGPRENRSRPAADPLFRSAAVHFGPRVVGVVLTGALSDGTLGLRAVRRCGGVAVVQHPADAEVPSMPQSALWNAGADHAVPLAEMGALIARLAAEPAGEPVAVPEDLMLEHRMALQDGSGIDSMDRIGERSTFCCPECGGTLWRIADGRLQRFRCHLGHALGAADLISAQSDAVKHAFWSALRAHEERTELLRSLAADARAQGRLRNAERWEARLREYEQQAALLREVILRDHPPLADAAED